MLEITVPESEFYDEEHNEFVTTKEQSLTLEHSLISLSKWETKYEKPYLSTTEKTAEEVLDYIRFMTITRNVDPVVYYNLSEQNKREIADYLKAGHTATTFRETRRQSRNSEIITSELIYYWMIASGIPFEAEKWPLKRLLTLIQVCSIKNDKPKKMSRSQILSEQRALNQARREKYGTPG